MDQNHFRGSFDLHLIRIKDGGVSTKCLADIWWSTASKRKLRNSYRHLPTKRVSTKDFCMAEINAAINGKP